jgi:threonine dehydrogenase-like Zn-dependent dehydrogenase
VVDHEGDGQLDHGQAALVGEDRELLGGVELALVGGAGQVEAGLRARGGGRARGGTISRVGAPQYEEAPIGFGSLFGHSITLTGGPAPARACIDELLPDIMEGRIEPGRVFDRTVGLDATPEGYRAMDTRQALKVLVRP